MATMFREVELSNVGMSSMSFLSNASQADKYTTHSAAEKPLETRHQYAVVAATTSTPDPKMGCS